MRPKQEETKKRYSIRLSDVEYYRLILKGNGSFTKGIRKAVDAYLNKPKKKPK